MKVLYGLFDFGVGTGILKQEVVGQGPNGIGLQGLNLGFVRHGGIFGKLLPHHRTQGRVFVGGSGRDVADQAHAVAVELIGLVWFGLV